MKDCNCNYGKPVCATIQKDIKPACPPKAVISLVPTVTAAQLKELTGCLTRVLETNEIYYVDDKHRPFQLGSLPLEADDYDYQNNPLGLRSKTVYDFANNRGIYYNASGEYRLFSLSEGA